jgi:hypothetical protein
VALLFAGSSSTTIGNPIGEVISKLNSALGTTLSFVGGPAQGAFLPQISQTAIDHATSVLEQNRHDLMSRPGVLGTGVGASDSDSHAAAIVVYVDKTAATRPQLPAQIGDVPVRVHPTEPFVAF